MTDRAKEAAYRVYVTDALKMVAENFAKFAGGSYPTKRYMDIFNSAPADNRSGEEIAIDVIQKCGLKVVE